MLSLLSQLQVKLRSKGCYPALKVQTLARIRVGVRPAGLPDSCPPARALEVSNRRRNQSQLMEASESQQRRKPKHRLEQDDGLMLRI